MKAVICQPIYRNVEADAAMSFTRLCVRTTMEGLVCDVKQVANTYLDMARNWLTSQARECRKAGATHVFFIDADQTVPSAALKRLLGHRKEVVSGLYFSRFPPYSPILFNGSKEFIANYPNDGLMKVGYIGFGCCLIELSVFDRLEKMMPKSGGVPKFFRCHLEDGTWASEDFYFCDLCEKAGVTRWVDTGLKCGHVGTVEVVEEHFRRELWSKAQFNVGNVQETFEQR